MKTSLMPDQKAGFWTTRRIKRIFANASLEAISGLTEQEGQRILANKSSIADEATGRIRELVDREEARCFIYENPKKYRVRPISDQMGTVQDLMGVGPANLTFAENPLPQGAEGYFAIPRWELLGVTYGEAVDKIFDMLSRRNSRAGNYSPEFFLKLGQSHLRQTEKTRVAFERIGDEQKGYETLIIPAQFGLFRHREYSNHIARKVMAEGEFGLGAFAVGMMLLTHMERLFGCSSPGIDCLGDDYASKNEGQFDSVPCLFRTFIPFSDSGGNKLIFGRSWLHSTPGGASGGASGFFLTPQLKS